MKKTLFLTLFFLLLLYARFYNSKQEYVNIYNWYGLLPKDVIDQFEKETNIKVRYDVFDNNEILEAKLFATNSGYDVVFPSTTPYIKRQIEAGIYMPLDFSKIPNIKEINPYLLEEYKKADPTYAFGIPYIWGTTGIIYDEEKIDFLLEDSKIKTSLRLLFDPKILKILAPFGISFLEESIDVFPMLFRAINISLYDHSIESLKKSESHLQKIRPFIKRFSTDRTSNDLLMGEIIAGLFWSGDAYRTILEGVKLGKKLKFIIPEEGASLWIDAMAIPKGAPNAHNAHLFINFCLRPQIAAMITNKTYAITSIDKAKEYISPELLKSDFLFPKKDQMEKLFLDQSSLDENYERTRLRLWTKIRKNKMRK